MTERFDEILAEARVLAELDAARAEVWVSGLLAEWADVDELLAALLAHGSAEAVAIACALTAIALGGADAVVEEFVSQGLPRPAWADAVGTAQAQQAWEIVDPFSGNVSVVIEYEHVDLVRHSLLVEIEDALAVDLHFGPPGLVDDAFDESDTRSLTVLEWPVDRAIARIAAAIVATAAHHDPPVTDEYLMNIALVAARVGVSSATTEGRDSSGGSAQVAARALPRHGTRDTAEAEGDATAVEMLRAALHRQLALPQPVSSVREGAATLRAKLSAANVPDLDALLDDIGLGDPALLDDATLLARLAGTFVVPGSLAMFSPIEREAVRGIEWADWLGAVIPLVRGGVGAAADPLELVRNINRCPEVTTTVPKRDVPLVADAFARVLHAWELTGVIDADGRLTELGAWIAPRALLDAWTGRTSSVS